MRYIGLVLVSLVSFVVLLGCPPRPLTPPPDADAADIVIVGEPDSAAWDGAVPKPLDAAPPSPPLDAGVVDDCALACAKLRSFGCAEGSETAGDGCTAVCRHTKDGTYDMQPTCIARQTSLAGVLECRKGLVKCTFAAPKPADGGAKK